jgi:hypothetical protein
MTPSFTAKNIVSALRHRFLQLDLRGKLTVALLGGTLVLGVVVTITAYLAARHQITTQSQMLLEARGKLEKREIELTLASMVDLAESIATNTVTANALADSRGREIYLTPLLRNQKLAVRRRQPDGGGLSRQAGGQQRRPGARLHHDAELCRHDGQRKAAAPACCANPASCRCCNWPCRSAIDSPNRPRAAS